MKILVTGAAGFIGAQLSRELAKRGDYVVGIDSINDYYDVRFKYDRLAENGFVFPDCDAPWGERFVSVIYPTLNFIRIDISNRESINALFEAESFDKVVNLAAQAGVRHSATNLYAYIESNILGFANILEACRCNNIMNLIYASSSSVYGLNSKVPFSEDDAVDTPVSLYAASKKSNELMAHCYSKLYGIKTIGLRFFTVYGPWGRPDMAPMLFARSISRGESINVFNNGDLSRDFTYIDDVVNGTIGTIDYQFTDLGLEGAIPYKIFNIGCSSPVKLMDFISEIEVALGIKANKKFLPMQQGDTYHTYADTSKLEREIGYKPIVSLRDGIQRFIEWYRSDKNSLK